MTKIIPPEETIQIVREGIAKLTELLEEFEKAADGLKRGEKNSLESMSDSIFAAMSLQMDQINKPLMAQSFSISQMMIEGYAQECHDDWIKSGKVFRPKTAMETDLWNGFHSFKKDGYSILVFHSDSFSKTFPIEAVGKGVDRETALEELRKTPMIKIMAILDLHKSFEDQWPYIPGQVFSPIHLTSKPVITIPNIDGSKSKVGIRHLRQV